MINFVVCDDEPSVRATLVKYIERFAKEHGETAHVQEFESGEELLRSNMMDADILLLDIEMEGRDGIEIAERLNAIMPDPCIIFVTNMTQYALKSYKVKPFGFLPKPVSYNVFGHEIAMAMKKVKKQAKHYIFVNDRDTETVHKINCNDICYLEIQNHNAFVVTENSILRCRGTLNAFEKELSKYGFFRPHASFLVNHRFISKITGNELLLSTGHRIPISKAKHKGFMQDILNYAGDLL